MRNLRFRWCLLEIGFLSLFLVLVVFTYRGNSPAHLFSNTQTSEAIIPKDIRYLQNATQALLDTESKKVKATRELAEEQRDLQESLKRLTGTVRANQLSGFARLSALTEASAAVDRYRVLALETLWGGQNLSEAMAAEEQNFIHGLDVFSRLARTTRTQALINETRQHFTQQGRLIHQLFELERVRNASLETYVQANGQLFSRFPKVPSPSPESLSLLATTGFRIGALLACCLLWVLLCDRWLARNLWKPLRKLQSAMEAASTGDVSRKGELPSSGEMGALTKALARLFGVIERSQNLVYHLATLVELSGDAIISQNLEGKILSWNKGAQRMYGYSLEEVKGQPIDSLMPPDEEILFRQMLEQVKKGKRPQPVEMVHRAKNGRTVQAFVHMTAIHDSKKQIIGVSLCAQEMSGGRHAVRKINVEERRGLEDWPGLTGG